MEDHCVDMECSSKKTSLTPFSVLKNKQEEELPKLYEKLNENQKKLIIQVFAKTGQLPRLPKITRFKGIKEIRNIMDYEITYLEMTDYVKLYGDTTITATLSFEDIQSPKLQLHKFDSSTPKPILREGENQFIQIGENKSRQDNQDSESSSGSESDLDSESVDSFVNQLKEKVEEQKIVGPNGEKLKDFKLKDPKSVPYKDSIQNSTILDTSQETSLMNSSSMEGETSIEMEKESTNKFDRSMEIINNGKKMEEELSKKYELKSKRREEELRKNYGNLQTMLLPSPNMKESAQNKEVSIMRINTEEKIERIIQSPNSVKEKTDESGTDASQTDDSESQLENTRDKHIIEQPDTIIQFNPKTQRKSVENNYTHAKKTESNSLFELARTFENYKYSVTKTITEWAQTLNKCTECHNKDQLREMETYIHNLNEKMEEIFLTVVKQQEELEKKIISGNLTEERRENTKLQSLERLIEQVSNRQDSYEDKMNRKLLMVQTQLKELQCKNKDTSHFMEIKESSKRNESEKEMDEYNEEKSRQINHNNMGVRNKIKLTQLKNKNEGLNSYAMVVGPRMQTTKNRDSKKEEIIKKKQVRFQEEITRVPLEDSENFRKGSNAGTIHHQLELQEINEKDPDLIVDKETRVVSFKDKTNKRKEISEEIHFGTRSLSIQERLQELAHGKEIQGINTQSTQEDSITTSMNSEQGIEQLRNKNFKKLVVKEEHKRFDIMRERNKRYINNPRSDDIIIIDSKNQSWQANQAKEKFVEMLPNHLEILFLRAKGLKFTNRNRFIIEFDDEIKVQDFYNKVTKEENILKYFDLIVPQPKTQKLAILGVPTTVKLDKISEQITKQLKQDFEIFYAKTFAENKERRNWMLVVRKTTSLKILKLEELQINRAICRVSPYYIARKCTKCWSFGHFTSQCKDDIYCAKCGKINHTKEQCTATITACINCKTAKARSYNHQADSLKCPEHKRYLNKCQNEAWEELK